MTPAEILNAVQAAGVHLRVHDGQLLASPKEKLTDEVRTLVREHRGEILAALTTRQPEHAHAHGVPDVLPTTTRSAPDHGGDCMGCTHLLMRVEHHEGTRRVFFWRCERGHPLLEGRNFGERVLLAPPACETTGDFSQWQAGQR